MSKVKFSIIDCKVKESYYLADYISEWHDKEDLVVNLKNSELKQLAYKTADEQGIELDENNVVLLQNPFGAVITLKHNETNTTLVIEASNFDHDGNELYLEDEDITKEFKFKDRHIIELLSGLTKYNTEATINNTHEIEIEINENCWLEFTNNELEEKIETKSIIDIILGEYAGKLVFVSIDHCGAIFSVKELNDLSEIEYIDVYSDLYIPSNADTEGFEKIDWCGIEKGPEAPDCNLEEMIKNLELNKEEN